jgi:hypothetical protein
MSCYDRCHRHLLGAFPGHAQEGGSAPLNLPLRLMPIVERNCFFFFAFAFALSVETWTHRTSLSRRLFFFFVDHS